MRQIFGVSDYAFNQCEVLFSDGGFLSKGFRPQVNSTQLKFIFFKKGSQRWTNQFVQGHPRSLISVPEEIADMTSYL